MNPDLDFELSWRPYQRECFHSEFLPAEKGNGNYPPEEACVIPTSCFTSQLPTVGAPYHVKTTIDISTDTEILHGNSVEYICKDNRRMDPSVSDDNEVSVFCNAGVLEAESAFPEEDQCRAVCNNIVVPPANGFEALPAIYEVLERDYLKITCADATHFVNDFWNSTSFSCERKKTTSESPKRRSKRGKILFLF